MAILCYKKTDCILQPILVSHIMFSVLYVMCLLAVMDVVLVSRLYIRNAFDR